MNDKGRIARAKSFVLPAGFLLMAGVLQGCSRPPTSAKNGIAAVTKREDPLESAVKIMQTARTTAEFKEALHFVDLHLQKDEVRNDVQLSKENRAALEHFHLDKEELSTVQAADFRPADAHHVEQCFLMRDVARALEQPDLDRAGQASLCLDWVARQVLLREGVDRLVPPYYVLQRGHGTARERALVFLALLHQLQIPACVLAWPEPAPGSPRGMLVGVVADPDKASAIYLFDPRGGRPVPAPGGKGIATLAQLSKSPDLFEGPGARGEGRGSRPEVLLACPLEALSPRMKILERDLADRDKVMLAIDPAGLKDQVARAAGDKVGVWNAPAQAGTPPATSPARMLRQFLPPGEGGSDTTGRLARIETERFPVSVLVRNYADMKLLNIHKDVDKMLLAVITPQLFVKYAHTPQELLLHGQHKLATKRLIGIHQIFDGEELAQPLGDMELARWREQAREAYLALERHERHGQELVDKLWKGDQFLMVLLQAQDDPDLRKHKKTTLSVIVLKAVREPLGEQTGYLLAKSMHEDAERAARRGHGHADWPNVAAWWRKYLERHAFDFAALPARLAFIRSRWQQADYEQAWDQLWNGMHRTAAARRLLARALELQGKQADAGKRLGDLERDLAQLQENAELQKELAAGVEKVRAIRSPVLVTFLESLVYDLGPSGGFAELRQQARLPTQKK